MWVTLDTIIYTSTRFVSLLVEHCEPCVFVCFPGLGKTVATAPPLPPFPTQLLDHHWNSHNLLAANSMNTVAGM